MKTLLSLFAFLCLTLGITLHAQPSLNETFPVRGFAIGLPDVSQATDFIAFVENDLAPARFNTLILRVDWNYDYQTHPELRNSSVWKKSDVKALADACARHNIKVVPQINLLGHQSWAGKLEKLLEKYPDFDETPHVKMPEEYKWPNDDGLYCKSYCPNHPDVHKVVFAVVDELLDAFGAKDFHAGMDEVFYLADDKCPRCGGLDPAGVFAQEVNKISNHLKLKDRRLWIWGDRLIDGKTTGMGMWEASMNNTARAVDMIDKNVMICDWHYNRPDPTAVYFAMKGLDVLTCPWNRPAVAEKQLEDLERLREHSSKQMAGHMQGFVQTVWSSYEGFKKEMAENKDDKSAGTCYKKVKEILKKYK